MNKTTRIWCTYHDPHQLIDYNLKETDLLKLYYTNNLTLKEDNINYLNSTLSEIVTYYYVWKNQLKTDYVGFCHYRRHFKCIKYNELENNKIEHLAWMQFNCHNLFDELNKWCPEYDYHFLINLYDEFLQINTNIKLNEYIKTHDYIGCPNRISYIFPWDIFNNVAGFIFNFLDFIGNKFNINWKTNIYDFENIIRKENSKLFNKYESYWSRSLSVLFEMLIGLYVYLAFDIVDDNPDKQYTIITCCDNENDLNKIYKKNIKTGITAFFNFSDVILDMSKYDCQYLTLYKKDEYMNDEIKNLLNEAHQIPIFLKNNEYIECDDSFEFIKGNYTIKNKI